VLFDSVAVKNKHVFVPPQGDLPLVNASTCALIAEP
jgi:hypothetical protein